MNTQHIKINGENDLNHISVDVIVPVFNCEKYLQFALDSLLNQSFKNIRIVAVNDGSTDRSKSILDHYKKNNEGKVFVYNKPNGGLSSARNYGLDRCESDYICFLDSDDIYDKDFILENVYYSLQHNCGMVFCDLLKINSSGRCIKRVNGINEFHPLAVYSGDDRYELLRLCVGAEGFRSIIQTKFFKMSALKSCNFRFHEGRVFEDWLAMPGLLISIDRIGYINKPLFQYRVVSGSISNSFSMKKFADRLYAWENASKILLSVNNQDILKKDLVEKMITQAFLINVVASSYKQILGRDSFYKHGRHILDVTRSEFSLTKLIIFGLRYPKLKIVFAISNLLITAVSEGFSKRNREGK